MAMSHLAYAIEQLSKKNYRGATGALKCAEMYMKSAADLKDDAKRKRAKR